MKILIACYSFTGNTLTVAKILEKKLNAQITMIEPVKDRWYVIKAIQAFMEKMVPIKDCVTNLKEYDTLLVCCPVWASRIPPGVRQYLSNIENIKDKKCAALITMGGNSNEIATTQIIYELENKGMKNLGICKITGQDQKSGSWEEKVEQFAAHLNNAN
jgi:menaquinone-dependent protoporphyrinogen IX oxidase